MNPARVVFPGFWFGESSLAAAEAAARRGVGGFCVYGGTSAQVSRFAEQMQEASGHGRLLLCAEMDDNLSEVISDAPALPDNFSLGADPDSDAAYRKGLFTARMARSVGMDWLLGPVVDTGYQSPAFSENPLTVSRLAGDFAAGVANAGALNCVKYFPGVSGILKTPAQLEDCEFVPYKHMFRRCDGIMLSDMVFANLDPSRRATMSPRIIRDLLKKRLNYKGCIVGAPLFKSRIKNEAAAALQMIRCGVDFILSPRSAEPVLDAVERACDRAELSDEVIRAISCHEMLAGKVASSHAAALGRKEAFEAAMHF